MLTYTYLTGEVLLIAISHDSKVVLVYEGFYYWDLRRWRMADSILDGVRFHGLKITQTGTTLTY